MAPIRYWISFERVPEPSFLNIGCGVTAFSEEDALSLLRSTLGRELPTITSIIADVDIRTLDEGHVIPNMGPPNERGVWFPIL